MRSNTIQRHRLLRGSPTGLSVIPPSRWTAADKRIWGDFDELIEDGTLFGGGPLPAKACMGRFNAQIVLLWRAIGDSLGPATFESGFGACRGFFDRRLVVSTWVVGYSNEGFCEYDDHLFAGANLLKGDGTYDVFSDKIPKHLVHFVTHSLFPKNWHEYFEAEDSKNALRDYLKKETESIDEIQDNVVRRHIKNILNKTTYHP